MVLQKHRRQAYCQSGRELLERLYTENGAGYTRVQDQVPVVTQILSNHQQQVRQHDTIALWWVGRYHVIAHTANRERYDSYFILHVSSDIFRLVDSSRFEQETTTFNTRDQRIPYLVNM